MSEELCRESLPYGALAKPIDHPWQQKKHVSMGFHKTPLWKVFPYTIPRSSVAKGNLKMTAFQEMSIIKITQPNLMILVSVSSAEDALSNGVK